MTSMSYRIRFISFWSQKNSDNPQTTSHQPANGSLKLVNKTVQPSPAQSLLLVKISSHRNESFVVSELAGSLYLSVPQSSDLEISIFPWLGLVNTKQSLWSVHLQERVRRRNILKKGKSDILTSITCGRGAGYTEHNTGKCSFKELHCKNTDEARKFMFFLSFFKRFTSKHS